MTRLSFSFLGVALLALGPACEGEPERLAGGPADAGRPIAADSGAGSDASPPPRPDGSPMADGAVTPGKVIFVTSTQQTGGLGGPDGADAICAARAEDAGLAGSFKAWLSTGEESAADRLAHASIPYVRTDGVRIADDWTDLVDGAIAAPINRDERGDPVGGDVWTGTDSDGSPDDAVCDGFDDGSSASSGLCGSSGASDAKWTDNIVPLCSTHLRLYCLEQ